MGRRKQDEDEALVGLLDREQLKRQADRADLVLQKQRLKLTREMGSLRKKAVATLRDVMLSSEDDRARYSAASKVLDFISPPKDRGAMININLGNFTSHLGLPAAPVDRQGRQTQLPPAPAIEAEVKMLPPAREIRKITPAAANEVGFSRKPIVTSDFSPPPEVEREEFSSLRKPEPEAQKLELKEPETIGAVEMYPESR